MPGLLLHLTLTLLWTFLNHGSLPDLTVGLIGSFILMAFFRGLLPIKDYVRRVWGFFLFLLIFLRELILANYAIAHAVLLKKTSQLKPNFLTYSIQGLSPLEIYVLSQCITLTPGTTTVEVRLDQEDLILHAFNAEDPAAVCRSIDATLKKAILGFSR